MKLRFKNRLSSTRVSRVQCGVPPNCVGACDFDFYRPRHQGLIVSPVSGETPETTRRRRVLPTRINSFRHA